MAQFGMLALILARQATRYSSSGYLQCIVEITYSRQSAEVPTPGGSDHNKMQEEAKNVPGHFVRIRRFRLVPRAEPTQGMSSLWWGQPPQISKIWFCRVCPPLDIQHRSVPLHVVRPPSLPLSFSSLGRES